MGVISLVGFVAAGVASWQELRSEVNVALERAVSTSIDDASFPHLGLGFFGSAGSTSGSLSGSSGSTGSTGANSGSGSSASSGDGSSTGAQGTLEGKDGSAGKDSQNGAGGQGDEGGEEGHAFTTVPVCVVAVALDGTTSVAKNSTASIYADVRDAVVAEALASGNQGGELNDYGLYYRVGETGIDGTTRIAFADMSNLRNNALGKIGSLFAGWLALMVAICIISFFLSRYVSRPVARAWEDQQRFIADASHELKTPLTVMLADTSILQANPDKTVGEQHAWVESISAEAQRMQQLTEDMLTLAQADAGVDTRQVMCDVDFSRAVQGVGLQFEAVAFERGLQLGCEVEDGLHVVGDERRLESLVKTLLENACKYASEKGHVDMRLVRAKGHAILSVRNDGDPVPPEDLPHLFDRFYRSDKARVNEGASASFGLGLSIAKATTQAHGGDISASSDASGTTFTVKLPLAKPARAKQLAAG